MAAVDRLKRQARVEAAVADAGVAAAEGHFTRAVSIIDAIPADDLTERALEVKADALESLARPARAEREAATARATDRIRRHPHQCG